MSDRTYLETLLIALDASPIAVLSRMGMTKASSVSIGCRLRPRPGRMARPAGGPTSNVSSPLPRPDLAVRVSPIPLRRLGARTAEAGLATIRSPASSATSWPMAPASCSTSQRRSGIGETRTARSGHMARLAGGPTSSVSSPLPVLSRTVMMRASSVSIAYRHQSKRAPFAT
jgi:hypothetical protein